MTLSLDVILGIALFLLALEKFGVAVPAWLTGIFLLGAAVLTLF